MQVTLVNPNVEVGSRLIRSYSGGYGDIVEHGAPNAIVFPPLELLRMAAVLEKRGVQAEVFDLQALPDQTLPKRTDCLVIQLSLPTWSEDCESALRLRTLLAAKRLLILAHITYEPLIEAIRARACADEVITPRHIAESVRLCTGMPIPTETSYVAPARRLIDNSPYRFAPLTALDASLRRITTANASFGCPYPCGYYCPYPVAEGKKFLPVPVPDLLDEMQEIALLGINAVVFRDPTFTLDMARSKRFCEALVGQRTGLSWWCETRLDRLDKELLAHMRRAGCRGIEIGVESGDAASQSSNTRKNLDLSRLISLRNEAKVLGMMIECLFVLGLPGDTRRNIAETFRFVARSRLNTDEFNFSTITPYPGTEFHADMLRESWFEASPESMTGYRVSTRTDKLSVLDIAQARCFGDMLREYIDGGTEDLEHLLSEVDRWAAHA